MPRVLVFVDTTVDCNLIALNNLVVGPSKGRLPRLWHLLPSLVLSSNTLVSNLVACDQEWRLCLLLRAIQKLRKRQLPVGEKLEAGP